MKIKKIKIKEVLEEELKGGSSDLVTRETGNIVRNRLENEISFPGDAIISLDFSDIGIIDYSCADEVISKLISRVNSMEYGEKFILLTNLTDEQKENIQVALERKKLAVIYYDKDKKWELLGTLNNYLTKTLEIIMEKGYITLRGLAEYLNIGLNTSGTRLLNLYKKRLVYREESVSPEAGRQFIYHPISPGE
ncbi:MAG: STAS-like domain-containing protein [Deltaproteobacteria bacterium]|nr:STAS-like domain-containing protein [Deltaproteobacteria bacterium]